MFCQIIYQESIYSINNIEEDYSISQSKILDIYNFVEKKWL